VHEVDAQRAGIIAVSRHIFTQPWRDLYHGYDTIFGIFARGQFIRIDIHDRAGAAVYAVTHEIMPSLRTASLWTFANNGRFNTRIGHRVHYAHKVRRELVVPAPRNGAHFNNAVFFCPLADWYGLAPPQHLTFTARKCKINLASILGETLHGLAKEWGKPCWNGRSDVLAAFHRRQRQQGYLVHEAKTSE